MAKIQHHYKTGTLALLIPFFLGSSPVENTLNSLNQLPKTGGTPACAASVTPTPTPVEPVKCNCKMIPLEGFPAFSFKGLKQPVKKRDQITFLQDNDNTLLMFMEYGDDTGYTNGIGVSYLKQLDLKRPDKNKSLTFDVMSELYTKEKIERPTNGKNYAVNFVDVSRFKAAYSQGESFYFVLGVGIEDRHTKLGRNRLTPEAYIQESWHEAFNLDLNQYDPAGESPAKIFSRTSLLMNAGVGKRTQLYEGRCEMQASANISVSTEDHKLIGQNSYASVEGGMKTNFLKTKKGDARFSTGLDATMMYFPEGSTDVEKFGARGSVSLGSNFHVGKDKKNNLQPFLTFTLPVGRQIFSPMTDPDVIQRIGLRFIFGN